MNMPHRMFFALLVALAALPALAQPGPGMGQGKGPAYRFNQGNTHGWSMMTRQERADHHDKMMSFKTKDECVAYMTEHQKLMQERAKEKGKSLPMPKINACERMQARGMVK